jgi:hypothetical protein
LKQTIELIRETGYEVDKVFLNGDELEWILKTYCWVV